MSYSLTFKDGGFTLSAIDHFSPELIFDCGQCFRFDKISEDTYGGVALSRYITVRSEQDGSFFITGFSEDEARILADFFALDDDYTAMREDILSTMRKNGISTDIMEKAMEAGRGIRILHQEKFECICSFIISQNNNIPRIKKIIDRLSYEFGEKFTSLEGEYYSFPTAKALLEAGEEKIFECKTGFRAKYLVSAATVCTDNFINELEALSDEELMKNLSTVKGIGPKVGSCISLFSFGRLSFFPIDVWVRRVMEKYYPENTSPEVFGAFAGLAQQYLFYYERYISNSNK